MVGIYYDLLYHWLFAFPVADCDNQWGVLEIGPNIMDYHIGVRVAKFLMEKKFPKQVLHGCSEFHVVVEACESGSGMQIRIIEENMQL